MKTIYVRTIRFISDKQADVWGNIPRDTLCKVTESGDLGLHVIADVNGKPVKAILRSYQYETSHIVVEAVQS